MAQAKKKKKTGKNNKGRGKKKKRPSLFLRLFKWLLVLGLWSVIFVAGVLLWFAQDLPDITQGATFERRALIVVKAKDGTTLARYGESKGQNINIDTVSPDLTHAILAIEDRRFYEHHGVDPLGIARAAVTNIVKGSFVQGGSTITQQLAKNLFLTHQRKLKRKIQEAMLAIWMERQLTKDEILSAYMNRVYLGSGTYGFEAAAQLYFGKSASDVTLHEAAILAGLLKAPSRYSPHNSLDKAKERAKIVLNAMIDAGYITDTDLSGQNMDITLPNHDSAKSRHTRYFTDWVIDGIDDLVGRPDMDMVIETTLDYDLQNHAHNTLQSTIDATDDMKFVSQGAILMMAPDGALLTMVGGYDYGQSQFNRTTMAYRPPGSAFKPFVYLAAIEHGWDANDKILDAPITEGKYSPKNFANKYYGEVTIEDALMRSMNTATLRLAQDVGISSILKTTSKLGIIAKLERDWSLVLGSSGVSMLEMGIAYATIANGGYRIFPYAINRITDGKGRVLYERKPPQSYQPVFKEKHVHELSDMMERVITDGTGRGASVPFRAAGKTGTSQDSRDAWFAGFSDKVVSVVWLGNDDNSPMRDITGGNLPAHIWRDVMLYGNERQSNSVIPDIIKRDNSGGISGLLGRLLSSDEDSSFTPKKRDARDFSHLND